MTNPASPPLPPALLSLLERLGRQRHLIALRDGIISAVPIILVGSTFLLLGAQKDVCRFIDAHGVPGFLQWAPIAWYMTNADVLLVPYRLTMALLSLYVVCTVAGSLARQYSLPVMPSCAGALATFLMTAAPQMAAFDGKNARVVVMEDLGPAGLFLAIACALGSVELARVIIRPKPSEGTAGAEGDVDAQGVPRAVGDAFRSFLPMLISVTLVWYVRHCLGVNLRQELVWALAPLERLGDSLACVLVVNLVLHLLQFAGVHGVSVINALFLTFWTQWLVANSDAHLAGQPLPYITAYPFYQWFVWIGGAGATLPAVLLLLRARHPHARAMARLALVPSLFNVNEPFIFGLPVVLSPVFAVPFIAAPVACAGVAWLALRFGLVARPFIEVPWVLPCFLGAPLSTGDWRALVLLAVNMALSALIWWPFLRAWQASLETGGASSPAAVASVTQE